MLPALSSSPDNTALWLAHAPPGAAALALSQWFLKNQKPLILVARDDRDLASYESQFKTFAPEIPLYIFPAWDCLPYDRLSPTSEIMAMRVKVLCELSAHPNTPAIILTTMAAALQRVPPQNAIAGRQLILKRGERIEEKTLSGFLAANGYFRTSTVREVGEYAWRGGIIDIFPTGEERPVRIDLFGSTIESLHYFDSLSQLSQEAVEEVILYPAREVILNPEQIALFRQNYREKFGAEVMKDPLYEAISAGQIYPGMEHWLPFFYPKMASLFDYAPTATLVGEELSANALRVRLDEISEYYQARTDYLRTIKKEESPYRPIQPELLYLDEKEWMRLNEDRDRLIIALGDTPGTAAIDVGAKPVESMAVGLKPGVSVFTALKARLSQYKNCHIVITCDSEGSRERLYKLAEESGIENLHQAKNWAEIIAGPKGLINFLCFDLEHGFISNDLAVFSESDILGEKLAKPARKTRRAENFLSEVSTIEAGDYLVHGEHGVGRYLGLENLTVSGAAHDCLAMEYLGGDKLYVPVENIEILSRYGKAESSVALDKLGSSYWQARKAKVKERLLDIANDLLKIAAERALKPGEVMPPPPSFTEFCARFPYAETEDQERAIIDTLGDLTSGKPMDRLICGDVGFGKTEVALRASYIAAGQGFQVAVVVPTTLLARQHYQTFSNRFAGTNLRIGQLSRLVGTSEAKQLKESISKHEVDIVIGTHALLSDAVKFANLGLLVIDEEQHFGVKQKERLKELRANVHVLTLTATPIPRTLQLALTGVKDLSLIASPPVDRLAVHTYVLPFDPVVIKEALLRERQRGGQSFYVCPRLADLPKIQETLRELTPELKSRTAHGQMAPSDLDQTMTDFYERKFDILISTNIVESGLDIPNANTLIIHRADMFGLAQLYQLRGRVGRSKTRAYAYLTLSERKQITADAERRLQVMQTLDHLGAGFTLASHDMDIRGSGNLLGDEQSGHIREVGIELYQQLLQEAVAAAREHKSNAVESEPFSPQINLGLPVMIPESYVADLSLRLSLYRRLSTLKTDTDIQSFAAELHDRFGKLPPEVENLLLVVSLKNLCLQAGIDKLDMGPKGAVIGFYKNRFAAPDKLIAYIQRQAGTMKLRPDNKIVVLRAFAEEDKGRFKIIQTVLFEIAGLLK